MANNSVKIAMDLAGQKDKTPVSVLGSKAGINTESLYREEIVDETRDNSIKIPFYRSIRTKFFFAAIVVGIIVFTLSQYTLMSSLSSLEASLIGSRLMADINYIKDLIGEGEWNLRGNALYLGNTMIGDGTPENANLEPFFDCEEKTGTFSYTFSRVSDEGLEWTGDEDTGYMQGHYCRMAGSTKGPNGESIVGTYMDKKVADVIDKEGIYMGPANVAGRMIYCVYETLCDEDGNIVGAIVVGRSIEEMRIQIQSTGKNYNIISIGGLAAVIILLFIIIAPWISGIDKIEERLKLIGTGEYPEDPLILKTGDEMENVANSINDMVESLKEKEILKREKTALSIEKDILNRKAVELEKSLTKEKNYRKGVQKNALVNFSANITRNRITEGGEAFREFTAANGNVRFHSLMKGFANECVFPEHRDMLIASLDEDKIISLLHVNPEFELSFKVNVEALSKVLNEGVKKPGESEASIGSIKREYMWVTMHAVIIRDTNDDILLYCDILDTDEKMVNEENIKRQATMDYLTGCLNRMAFEDEMNAYLQHPEASGTLFMIDLDHFKDVNDNLGHPMGDELLQLTADTIRKIFRHDDIICRLGGDEFCAFARGLTDKDLVLRRADTMIDKGHRTYDTPSGGKIKVSFSIGISRFPDDAVNYEDLYRFADKALYMAKENGRDRYSIYRS